MTTTKDDKVYTSASGYNYTFVFDFEKKYFDDAYVDDGLNWLRRNWTFSVWCASVYLCLVFVGTQYMKSRPKYELRAPLVLWNLFLAIFSLIGTIRILPEFFSTLSSRGFEYSVCHLDFSRGVQGCWMWFFVLSKVAELVDTAFIVLRKQELIFLHWYHHCTVLIYSWYAIGDETGAGNWFMAMNYSIHTFMYGYYAMRALRLNPPKWVSFAITVCQLLQMVMGIVTNLWAYSAKEAGRPCVISYSNMKITFIMYGSYFLLFFNFLYKVYLTPSGKRSMKSVASDANIKKKT